MATKPKESGLLQLMWLSCSGVIPHTERSPTGFWLGYLSGLQVQSLVRAHTDGNQSMFLSHMDVSLPFSLPSSLPL